MQTPHLRARAQAHIFLVRTSQCTLHSLIRTLPMLSHRHWLKVEGISVAHFSKHCHLYVMSLLGVLFFSFVSFLSLHRLPVLCHDLIVYLFSITTFSVIDLVGEDQINLLSLCSLEWNVWLLWPLRLHTQESDRILRVTGGEVPGIQQERRSWVGNKRRNAGSGPKKENQATGSKREGEKEKVRCEILVCGKNSSFPDKPLQDWCEEVAEYGLGPCESVARSSRWHRAHRKIEVEEADGTSSRQERVGVVVFPLLEVNKLEVNEELSTMATLAWAEGMWIGRWKKQQKAWRKQIFEVQIWRQVSGPAGAVMRETRDLGIKWPQWHTSLFEGQVAVGTRVVCLQDAKKT